MRSIVTSRSGDSSRPLSAAIRAYRATSVHFVLKPTTRRTDRLGRQPRLFAARHLGARLGVICGATSVLLSRVHSSIDNRADRLV